MATGSVVADVTGPAPVLDLIGARSVDEGRLSPDYTQAGTYLAAFIVSDRLLADVANGSDPDGPIPAMFAENLPANAVYEDRGNGAGKFDFNPDFSPAGVYNLRFIVTDGSLADTEMVAVTVNNVNRPPALASINDKIVADSQVVRVTVTNTNLPPTLNPIGGQAVTEGQVLDVGISASDPEGLPPVLSAVNTPSNSTFTDYGDGTGAFVFLPGFTQAGTYFVTFIASDGSFADSELVTVTVNEAGNQAPRAFPHWDTITG